ncbi:MAG: VOC family protein [Dehalococcoidia bacterium]
MQKITTFLWFDNNAEEAMKFYTSVFKSAKVVDVNRYPEGEGIPEGGVTTGTFQIAGQEFMVLNGGPQFKFTEAISLFVNCEDQAEVDYYWQELTADGGEESMCGWLKDKYGLSWQIIPEALGRLMGDPDPEKSQRVMQAMLQMQKIDVAKLEKAAAAG